MLKLFKKSFLLSGSIAMLLCCAFMAQWTSGIAWVCYYDSHVNYITVHYCINKDHPEMHCDGKCYLHRKLRQNEKNKDGSQANTTAKNDIILFPPFQAALQLIQPAEKCHVLRYDQQPLTQGYCRNIFHPPAEA